MNVFRAVIAVIVLAQAGVAFAQEWTEFQSREDGFTCNFPGKPTVTTTTWKSEHGAVLPARVYGAALGQSRYSMTVVDYTGVEHGESQVVPPWRGDVPRRWPAHRRRLLENRLAGGADLRVVEAAATRRQADAPDVEPNELGGRRSDSS